jgi:CRISPR-associated protein Csy3
MTVNLPNFLNYTRSISIGEGFMYGIKSTDEGKSEFVPIEVVKRGIRGTISNYSNIYENGAARKDDDIQKQVKSPENANLQQIESAYLPNDCDRIAIKFSVAFQAESLKPSGCNSKEFYDIATEVASKYKSLGGYKELAIRYFWNVINGRTMWRNSLCQNKTVEIKVDNDKTYKFSAEGISLAKFDANELPSGSEEIVNEIAKALAGDRMPLILDVTISGELPGGSEVYPSQEYLPDVESRKRGKQYGKVLSSITTTWKNRNDFRHATMHSQKIGNAIRCIDEWHGRLDEFGTTPIEVYGYVLARNDAIRLPYKKGRNPECSLILINWMRFWIGLIALAMSLK